MLTTTSKPRSYGVRPHPPFRNSWMQVADLFAFPALHDLGTGLGAGRTSMGGAHSPTALLAATVAVRIVGSQRALLALLNEQTVWDRCNQNYRQMTGGDTLSPSPPTNGQLRYFRDKLFRDADASVSLQSHFRDDAIRQAKHLGNLQPSQSAAEADTGSRNHVTVATTRLRPYSDVRMVPHRTSGELILRGSRAQSIATARLPAALSECSMPGVSVRGVDFVSAHTWTSAGHVVLGTASALQSARKGMIELVDDLAVRAERTMICARQPAGIHVNMLQLAPAIEVHEAGSSRCLPCLHHAATDQRPLNRPLGRDSPGPHSWLRDCFLHRGRAASESLAAQELDVLAAGLMVNSRTWHRWSLTDAGDSDR